MIRSNIIIMLNYVWEGRRFILLVLGLYLCFFASALNYERMLKRPFINTSTKAPQYFTQILTLSFLAHFFCAVIGKVSLTLKNRSNSLPLSACLSCGSLMTLNAYSYNMAIIHSSFISAVMVKSCGLISAILVAVLCSGVREQKLRLGKEKIGIGAVVCSGIVVFNMFFQSDAVNKQDKPLEFLSLNSLCLVISLTGDGFIPQLQAKIKSQYNPTALELYTSINTVAFIFPLLIMILQGQLLPTLHWLLIHQTSISTICILSLFNALGQLFIYEMVRNYKQHIVPFVIAIRKCMTVLINITYYGHILGGLQMLGLSLVFLGVGLEVYSNYLEGTRGEEEGERKRLTEDEDGEEEIGDLELGEMEELRENGKY